jgi:uncharacterized coiled-coil DUF342 family protein
MLAIGVAASAYLYNQRNVSKKDSADSSGQIEALDVYKELLANERLAKEREVTRADLLSKERNDAHQELWLLKGQLQAMTEQMQAQRIELDTLRKQLDELREQINHRA